MGLSENYEQIKRFEYNFEKYKEGTNIHIQNISFTGDFNLDKDFKQEFFDYLLRFHKQYKKELNDIIEKDLMVRKKSLEERMRAQYQDLLGDINEIPRINKLKGV